MERCIDDEFKSLDDNSTQVLDEHPTSWRLPTHFVLKVRRLVDGGVERLKGRLVAVGYHQVWGKNFVKSHAPLVSLTVARIFFYLGLCINMFMAQVDVKTAFLNEVWEEDIWVISTHPIPNRPS